MIESHISNSLMNICEVRTFSSLYSEHENIVNELLNSNEWVLISCSSGTDRDGYPIHGWVLGKHHSELMNK